MIVAIDGPAGCGKSTIAKLVAKELGYYFLNTGSFYRAIAYSLLEKGGDPEDREGALSLARSLAFSVKDGDLCVDGEDVEDRLHTKPVDKASSIVSTDPRLRQVVTDAVRRIAGQMDIVTEGRDTTTVIFPDAACKFYFDATPQVRAQRRIAQQGEGQSYEEVLRLIMERDERDRNKEVGSLKVAPDAVIIDTSHLTIAQVCEKVVSVVRSRSGMGVDK